ncbi:Putative GTPase [Aromatoleum bremense]|nr:Putative GTPase [Aromatoleum bremense]
MVGSQTNGTAAMSLSEDIDPVAVIGGSRPALARALTSIENARPGAAELLASLASHRGRAHVVGITGAPGAGKSTLINALLGELLARGRRIAVVAVDPSSPVTGGALLGDRVRMGGHGADERVFIRSLSSRGHLGGLSRTTAQLVDVFDAAGFDVVVVETVGVGQSEVEIGRVADTKVVVCPPGLGDEVQAIKAGILEIADILVVNKGDSPLAARTMLDLQTSGGLQRDEHWTVPVLRTVATSGEGIAELVERIDAHAHAHVIGIGRRLRAATPSGASDAMPAAPATDDELFEQLRRWRTAGRGVALATVVRTWGSSPRPEGSHLAVEESGAFLGSVSGGCIEGAVISEAKEVIADGTPRLLEFGVSDEQAWEVGLACGGRVQVLVERIE